MAFHVGNLPKQVKDLFYNKDADWAMVYWAARDCGITDTDTLTNILFYKEYKFLVLPFITIPLTKEMPDFDKLSKAWLDYRSLVQSQAGGSGKVPKAKGWKPYEDSIYPDAGFLSAPIKAWLAKPPSARAEAGLFRSNRTDGGVNLYFLAWKTKDPTGKCISHAAHESSVLHGCLELETWLPTLKAKPADEELRKAMPVNPFGTSGDTGYLGIAGMNLFVNIRMVRHVYGSGQCLRNAQSRAWREAKEDGKKALEAVQGIIGIAGGAKPGTAGGGKPGGVVHGMSKLDLKGFGEQLKKIYDGDFGRREVMAISGTYLAHETIKGSDGRTVGTIRHFD
jgi:hypothetical protein